MLKILQARLQYCVNHELPDVQAGFRKGRGTRDQIANVWWIIEKAREFQKNIYFCFIEYAKTFDCVVHNRLWKIQEIFHLHGLQTITLISHASKVMLKILKARLQQYVNRELPDIQAGFRKATDPLILAKGSATLLLQLESKAHVHAPTRDED